MESATDIPAGEFIATTPLEAHPVADIMPMMEGDEYEDVKASIKEHGLKNAIVLYEGKILDGRNRYNICMELHIPVRAREWEGGMDPIDYVVSMNIKRRQLTPAARAMCAAKAMGWHSEQAKLRQVEAGKEHAANLKQFADDRLHAPVHEAEESAPPVIETEVIEPERAPAFEQQAISQAGKQFHVSGRSVAAAKTILEHGTPEEIKAIETGRSGLKPIEKQVRQRLKEERGESIKPQPEATPVIIEEVQQQLIPAKAQPSFGRVAMQMAELAVDQLSRIKKEDPARESAFNYVINWIEEERRSQ